MSTVTAIQWTDHTFNVAWGCEKVGPGCKHCYAEGDAKRYGFDVWGGDKDRRTFGQKHWDEPLKWNRDAKSEGRRHRVFTSSMADVFEDHPAINPLRPRLFDLIRATPWLDWQILTKRSERMRDLWPWQDCPPNVWAGVSVENSDYLHRIDHLRDVPLDVRFVSFEPLLGSVVDADLTDIAWAIFGGESRGGRPCDVTWIREGIELCGRYGTTPFVKQLGSNVWNGAHCMGKVKLKHPKGGDMNEWPEDLRVRGFPT